MNDHRMRIAEWATVCLLSALTCAVPQARATDDVLTPYHVGKIRNVGAAVISPDGKYIAYTLSVPRRPFADESGPDWTELHVTDLEGARASKLYAAIGSIGKSFMDIETSAFRMLEQ